MDIHPLYGPVVPEKGWVPAPRYLLRRDRILQFLADSPAGQSLEIGCGAGTLLHELGLRGFTCEALETSAPALEIARHVNANNVVFHQTPQPDWVDRFDYLLAFEVLEHIEDDRAALLEWRSWIKPGGVILMSVPAHMRKWTATDDWAGHYRRYEQRDLKQLLLSCGFVMQRFESYGFPLGNMVEPIRARVHAKSLATRRANERDEYKSNTELSSVERPVESRLYPFLASLPGQLMMRSAFFMQRFFKNSDLGNGYFLIARKSHL